MPSETQTSWPLRHAMVLKRPICSVGRALCQNAVQNPWHQLPITAMMISYHRPYHLGMDSTCPAWTPVSAMICHVAWVAKAAGTSRWTGRQVDSVSSCKSSGHSAGICSKKVKLVQPSRPSQWTVGRMFRQDENSIKHECSCLAWKSMKQYIYILGYPWCDSSLLHRTMIPFSVLSTILAWTVEPKLPKGVQAWVQAACLLRCLSSCPSVLLNLHHHPRPDLLTNLVGSEGTKVDEATAKCAAPFPVVFILLVLNAGNFREWSISSLVIIIPFPQSHPFPTFSTSKSCYASSLVIQTGWQAHG